MAVFETQAYHPFATYNWEILPDNSNSWANFSTHFGSRGEGFHTNRAEIPDNEITQQDAGQVRCRITNESGVSVYTSVVRLNYAKTTIVVTPSQLILKARPADV